MMEPSLPEKIVAIHGSLRSSRIPHAFGGALALAYYAEPRVTRDIDLNVFLSPEKHQEIRMSLEGLGVTFNIDTARLLQEGQVRVWWGQNPVDLFFAYDAFHEAIRQRVRKVPFGKKTIPIIGPEHLTVCKVLFNRPKDWLDIEQILIVVSDLKIQEISSWLERLIGVDDVRSRRFDELVELTLGPDPA